MKRLAAALLLTTIFHTAAAAQAPGGNATTPEGDIAAFFRLRTEAVAAMRADDLDTATTRLAQADARNPNHPGLTLLRARVAMASGDEGQAIALVQQYARYGLVLDLTRDRALSGLAGMPALAAAEARLAANAAPVGADRLDTLFEVAGDGLVETAVHDPQRNRWLVSLVRGRTVATIQADGQVTDLLAPDPTRGGVVGLALSGDGRTLWAATAPLPPALAALGPDSAKPASALLRIDAGTGAIVARYPAPDGAELGDVALGADGAVLISDSTGGAIYRLTPGAQSLDRLLAPGTVASPQGLAPTPDGRAFIVADYASGLWRINLEDGSVARMAVPADASLVGLDGLTVHEGALFGIQNGSAPQRVLRFRPNAEWTGIEAIDVLAANLAEIDEPTTLTARRGELVFVSRSQWNAFETDGRLKSETPAPARIARLRLD